MLNVEFAVRSKMLYDLKMEEEVKPMEVVRYCVHGEKSRRSSN
jgi:hypothetical protein